MELRIENINTTSPYKVYKSGENLRFDTDSGTVYEVGFVEDYSILEENVYQFFISIRQGLPTHRDLNVKLTIQSILHSFFETTEYGMVYICDMADGKQGLRSRLFNMWFNDYETKELYTYLTAHVDFEGIGYYAAGLIRNDNPMRPTFVEAFNDFVASFKAKLEE